MEDVDIIIYTLFHQCVIEVWQRLTLMLIRLKKDWNDNHNDGLRGKKKCSKLIVYETIKIMRTNKNLNQTLILVIIFIGFVRKPS
jgi:uncharacterized membrane protein YobD (UPF0266 family)